MTDSGERLVPYYCPYCGGENLRPHEEPREDAREGSREGPPLNAWECRECTRVFTVKFVGLVVTQ